MTIKLLWCSAKIVRHRSLNIIWLDFEPKQSPSLAKKPGGGGGEMTPNSITLKDECVFVNTIVLCEIHRIIPEICNKNDYYIRCQKSIPGVDRGLIGWLIYSQIRARSKSSSWVMLRAFTISLCKIWCENKPFVFLSEIWFKYIMCKRFDIPSILSNRVLVLININIT